MGDVAIIPAVLPKDETELEDSFGAVKGVADEIHLDICDGKFTPEKSWPYNTEEDFQKFLARAAKEESLPFWQDFDFEVHLMVLQPEKVVNNWFLAGASRFIVHAEAVKSFSDIAGFLQGRAVLGLGLRLDTPTSEIGKYLEMIDFVHLMSIAEPGYQGSEFDERIFGRIKEIKTAYPDLEISVDGGVDDENAPALVSAGARRLIAGSAIFSKGVPRDNYRNILKSVGNSNQ